MALIKENMFVEFKGIQISQKEVFAKARDEWKKSGNKVKDLSSVNVYYKPEEGKCYYVMNKDSDDEMTGSFDF